MESMVSTSHPTQHHDFNPYTDNGGTILAIAGADFSVIAGDTRQTEGYSIQTRYAPKVFRLYVSIPTFFHSNRLISFDRTDKAVLAVNGFAADGNMFVKRVRQRLEVCIQSVEVFDIQYLMINVSGIGTLMQKICPFMPSRALFKQCFMHVVFFHTTSTIF